MQFSLFVISMCLLKIICLSEWHTRTRHCFLSILKASLIDWKLNLVEMFQLHLCPQVGLEKGDGHTHPLSGIF